ncbi:unnamed protein product, partial [Pylaiella littoralis]
LEVALNGPQYDDSLLCGSCIEGEFPQGSSGNAIPDTYMAYVSDKCPECVEGDLDFGISGDGRLLVDWKLVPCPGESTSFHFEGSNGYYWKVQVRGTETPVLTLSINEEEAARTDDNFFELENQSG